MPTLPRYATGPVGSACVVLHLDDPQHARRTPDQDAAVIIEGWRRWGEELPDQLPGRFAFALFDGEAVVLARDPMGEIPLYYCVLPGEVVVAGTPAEVLAHPDVPGEVDVEAVALRLAMCFNRLTRRTDFTHVQQVAPGTTLRITAEGMQERTYWRPEPRAEWTAGFGEAVAHGEDLLRTAIRARLPLGGVGVHLSGGLDSSLITALAATERATSGRAAPLAYCWSPPPPADATDREYAGLDAVARRYGLQLTYADPAGLRGGRANPLVDPPMAWRIEQGNAAHAAAHGVATMLTGWGGDEALSMSGGPVAASLRRRGSLVKAWRAATPGRGSSQRLRGRLSRLRGARPNPPSEWALAVDSAWRRYSPDIADSRARSWRAITSAPTPRDRMLAYLRNGHLAARNASWHRGGATVGLTYASPLQDRRVVDFALSLPPDFLSYDGQRRRLFRAIARPFLPPEVIAATKTADAEPARVNLSTDLAIAYRREALAAGRDLGWPPELLEAWSLMYAQLYRA